MKDENPYESPKTLDEVVEKPQEEELPILAKSGAGLLFLCLGLFIVALLITLCDPFFVVEDGGKALIDSHISLKYGIPIMKIGIFSGVIGFLLMTPAIIVRCCRKKISPFENKSKSNG
jgi:hypothetical protein